VKESQLASKCIVAHREGMTMENIYVHKTDTHELTAVNYHMIDEIITSIA